MCFCCFVWVAEVGLGGTEADVPSYIVWKSVGPGRYRWGMVFLKEIEESQAHG